MAEYPGRMFNVLNVSVTEKFTVYSITQNLIRALNSLGPLCHVTLFGALGDSVTNGVSKSKKEM